MNNQPSVIHGLHLRRIEITVIQDGSKGMFLFEEGLNVVQKLTGKPREELIDHFNRGHILRTKGEVRWQNKTLAAGLEIKEVLLS